MKEIVMDVTALPRPYSRADADRGLDEWNALAKRQNDRPIANAENQPLLEAIFGNSPYLSRLLLQYPDILNSLPGRGRVRRGALSNSGANNAPLLTSPLQGEEMSELMKYLRLEKGKLALRVALADIAGSWTLEQITAALSDFAEASLTLAVDTLLRLAHKRGDITLPHPDAPSKDSGIIILGMGKLGGHELNYSSDIDLIIFYVPGALSYKGRHTEQKFMNSLVHDLVSVMQERGPQGYVFRTDIRLRPDPASTPPAITTDAAYTYYESVGQNWERAAMIKAKPVAGDIKAGEEFLNSLAPFMWRRNLDFAAINDIHSIKRQMDSLRSKDIKLKGHNIKVGMGGIREIEFYAQIHQLIWGGRQPTLRSRATCETLSHLVELGLIDESKKDILTRAYAFLRKLEHRLQMVADQQTHSLPETDEGIAHIASFMGYENVDTFSRDVLECLHAVHAIYTTSFQSAEKLGNEGNLVFTGVGHDADTLATLRGMGYSHPETVSEIVMGWHHGSRKSTRTKRARELLTEMMPTLLKRLGETAHPDAALLKFDEFLHNLPAGVQLFSLFAANPHLLGLIADIMGGAPTLAESLSKMPELLDAVLYADFYEALPSPEQLAAQLRETLAPTHDFEDQMDELRRFRNEKQFQAGVQLLKALVNAQQASLFLSSLADILIRKAVEIVTAEFAATYGHIEGSQFAVIALGKLGSREMTFSSDIDLVFVYDVKDFETYSDGEKSFTASVYFNRLAQRLLSALTAMGRDGRLYEVDTRLRPSGKEGLLAVSTQALTHYFEELAWTFEYMAFTKARIVSSTSSFALSEGSPAAQDPSVKPKDDELKINLDQFIRTQLSKPRDAQKLREDANDMRLRIEKAHSTQNPWDIKYVRGGLMDMDFIAQYLMLLHAPNTPGANPGSATDIFGWLKRTGRIAPELADSLITYDRFLGQIFNMLRLCCDRHFVEETAPRGLKTLLVESFREKDFESLKNQLIEVERVVYGQYSALLQP